MLEAKSFLNIQYKHPSGRPSVQGMEALDVSEPGFVAHSDDAVNYFDGTESALHLKVSVFWTVPRGGIFVLGRSKSRRSNVRRTLVKR